MDPSMSMSEQMRRWSEDFVNKIQALEEENATLKSKLVELENKDKEKMSNSSEDPPRKEVREKSGMNGSLVSISDGVDSQTKEIHVKEEQVDEFIPDGDSDNLQTETPPLNEDEIDIKEEDVGYESRKSKSDAVDNSLHDPPLPVPRNVDVGQSSQIPLKNEIDKSIQRMFRSTEQVSTTEPVPLSCRVHTEADVGSGTDRELNPSSSKYITRNVVRQKLANPQPQLSSRKLCGQKVPHLMTLVGAKSHTCNNCSATFETEFKLREHNKWHTGEKKIRRTNPKIRFKCSVCEETFTAESILTAHLRTHTAVECAEGIPSTSLEVDKRSSTVQKVNPQGQPKKKQKVQTQPEVCNDEQMAQGVEERIDSVDLPAPRADERNPHITEKADLVASGKKLGSDVSVSDLKRNPQIPMVVAIHPPQIEKVLSLVLDYVDGEDLKTCRLVCKEWNRLTLPFTRSRFLALLGGTVKNGKIELGFESFVKHMEESNALGLEIPFGRFCIYCLEDTPREVVLRFAQLCQPTVQEYILSGEVNQMTLSTLLESTPNLTTLKVPCTLSAKNKNLIRLFPIENEKPNLKFLRTLRVGNHSYTLIEGNCPTYFDELFGVAQSITTLDVESSYDNTDLKVLEGLLRHGNVEFIQTLKLGHVTAKHVDVFKKMNGLKLKHLHLENHNSEKNFDWVELLGLFKESLISLRISRDTNSIIFPPMPKLELLQLLVQDASKLRCLGNECFNTTFPSLIKLFLCLPNANEEMKNLFSNFLTPHPTESPTSTSVKSLILRNYPKVNMVVFHHLQSTFNFSALRMLDFVIGEDGNVLRQIWTHLTQLEGLDINGYNLNPSTDLDPLITGIPVHEMDQMGTLAQRIKLLGKMTKEDREKEILRLTNKYCKFPSIHNLTNLKSLRLYVLGRETETLTDLSAYLGLYSLKSIQHLYVKFSQISRDCARMIVKDKNLKTWKIGSMRSSKDRCGKNVYVFPYAIRDSGV